MKDIDYLLKQNKKWAFEINNKDPSFFTNLSHQQNPEYLWIGCSDSRVPANQIIDLPPGEVFVHRNIANVFYHNDMNALSVIQYAVDVLKVRHIMVVGHYGCGGVRAAVTGIECGILDYWLYSIRELFSLHNSSLKKLSLDEKINKMCELNVEKQVHKLAQTKIIQNAWKKNQALSIHGWIYGLENGVISDLGCTIN